MLLDRDVGQLIASLPAKQPPFYRELLPVQRLGGCALAVVLCTLAIGMVLVGEDWGVDRDEDWPRTGADLGGSDIY